MNEPDDLGHLLQDHVPALHAFLRARCGPLVSDRESFSDLVQSVCVELLRERPRFEYRSDDALRHWLFRAAERKIVDRARHWRADRRDPARLVPIDEDRLLAGYGAACTPSRDLATREALARIERAFDDLPADYREVITGSRFLGMSHRELAERMQRSEGAVRVLLSRALARLSCLLADD